MNQDGRTANLTAPNGLSQKRILHTVLLKATIEPSEVMYFECHGTGASLGDPIEVSAFLNAFQSIASPTRVPLSCAAVKTNLGHLEGSAGIIGLRKCIDNA